MKCLSVRRIVLAASLAFAAAHAEGADVANPTGFLYYGYGNGSFGYAPGMTAGYGATPGMYAGYPGYGYGAGAPAYGAPAYGANGYGGYGGGGYGGGGCGGGGCGANGHGGWRRHGRHACSFGGNCDCCSNVWDGYGAGGCGAGGCGAPVKVYGRHRALGNGAGPCVDPSCGNAVYGGRRHLCHLRRRWQNGCGPAGGYNLDAGMTGGGMAGPEMMYDNGAAGSNPNAEPLVAPPSPNMNEGEPRPMPGEDSST